MLENINLEKFFFYSCLEINKYLGKLKDLEDIAVILDIEIVKKIKEYSYILLEYPETAIEKEWGEADCTLIVLIDIELVKSFLNSLGTDNSRILSKEVLKNLEYISASLNLMSGMEVYTPDEFKEIFLESKIQIDYLRFFHTLGQIFVGLDKNKYIEFILVFLSVDSVINRQKLINEEALIISLFLRIVWKNFIFLNFDDKKLLLQNYLYRSVVTGVPVLKILKDYFYYNSYDEYSYLIEHTKIIPELKQNKEIVNLDSDITSGEAVNKKLIDVINGYEVRSGGKVLDGFSQQEYIKELFEKEKKKQFYVGWFMQIFFIFFHTERCTLIEIPHFKEDSEEKIQSKELSEILLKIFFEDEWGDIVKYYQQEKSLVPIEVIFRNYARNFNLKNEAAVQRFAKLSDLLKKEGIINEDILEFHESDGQFHWNKNLLP